MHKQIVNYLVPMTLIHRMMGLEEFASFNQFLDRYLTELRAGNIKSNEDSMRTIMKIATDMSEENLDEF
jgi:hypothetical protein